MSFLHTLWAFIAALGTLVIVHEMGHFLVARSFGVKVERFSIGFGKVIWSRRFGSDQTEWAVSAIPLGGYVSWADEGIEGATASHHAMERSRLFALQPLSIRAAIVLAGPMANLMLAVVLYAFLGMLGREEPIARLGAPLPESPAAHAGFREGDLVTQVNGTAAQTWADVRWQLVKSAGQAGIAQVAVDRSGTMVKLTLDFTQLAGRELDADMVEKQGLRLRSPKVVLAAVLPGSEAARVGIRPGDVVIAVDGKFVQNASLVREQIRDHAGQSLRLDLERGGLGVQVDLVPQDFVESPGAAPIGRVGVSIMSKFETRKVELDFPDACLEGAKRTWDTSIFSLRMIGRMLIGEVSVKNLSGPVTIAKYAGQSASIGLEAFVGFLALISISIGVLNLLPIPMLDGGHLLYYLIELARGKPLSEAVMEVGLRAGFAVLIALMTLALFNDFTH
jgi:regulator of sigma E protease